MKFQHMIIDRFFELICIRIAGSNKSNFLAQIRQALNCAFGKEKPIHDSVIPREAYLCLFCLDTLDSSHFQSRVYLVFLRAFR